MLLFVVHAPLWGSSHPQLNYLHQSPCLTDDRMTGQSSLRSGCQLLLPLGAVRLGRQVEELVQSSLLQQQGFPVSREYEGDVLEAGSLLMHYLEVLACWCKAG